ncbi:MAG: redox-regulated ATPase YchF [Christensenellaceae bacterium]|jgi:GTP-binding protein YchF|nr:redox-regulated ATPase YchF [Christensenellaceae bacterium]
MKLGVVGLPNVGKSTLFNALTKAGAQAANYPFCTIEPNTGIVPVPDERLAVLTRLYDSAKTTPATIEFVDIAGLVRGASKGEGLGNKFLSHIREVDAIVHVVRCFEDENITHVEGSIDPLRDMETINMELIYADIESIERRAARSRKAGQAGDAAAKAEADVAERVMEALNQGLPARSVPLSEEEKEIAKGFFLLTTKPVLYAANIAEKELGQEENEMVKRLRTAAKAESAGVLVISARVEEELSELSDEERLEFLQTLGLEAPGLDRLVTESYALLGLISYLTAGPKESRAWTIERGMTAPQAAGKIHSDFERGFIRAEIVRYDDLIAQGSMAACKEKGLVRSEGKEYVVQDGDVVLFRFNV